MSGKQIVLDIKQVAVETACYIKSYMEIELDKSFEQQFTKDLENLLFSYFQETIESNINPLIRMTNVFSRNIFEIFSKNYSLDQILLENTIEHLASVKMITNLINENMGVNTFNSWVIQKYSTFYVLESFGDYRLNQWYSEHVKNGKYI